MLFVKALSAEKKALLYHVYFKLIQPDEIQYKKISRRQMAEEILEFYRQNGIIGVIKDIEEWTFLKKLTEKELPELIPSTLYYKRLVASDGTIYEELLSMVKEALKPEAYAAVKKRQEDIRLLQAVMDVYGIVEEEKILDLLEHYNPNKKKEDWEELLYQCPAVRFIYTLLEENKSWLCKEELLSQFETLVQIRQTYCPQAVLYSREKLFEIARLHYDPSDPLVVGFIHRHDPAIVEAMLQAAQFGGTLDQLEREIQRLPKEIRLAYFKEEDQFKKIYSRLPSTGGYGAALKLKKNAAKITDQQAKLFFECYFGLLEFAAKKENIKGLFTQGIMDLQKGAEVRELLVQKTQLLEAYLQTGTLSAQKKKIITNFRFMILDIFILLQYNADGALMMGKNGLYLVKGLLSSFENLIDAAQLPCAVRTLLLPFEHQIIYDGILEPFPFDFSDSLKEGLFHEAAHLEVLTELNTEEKA